MEVQGVHHIAISVSNLDCSQAWYETVLGVPPHAVDRSRQESVGEATTGGGVLDLRIASYWIGNTYIDLLEYVQPRGRPFDRGPNDVGSAHLSLLVDDIDAACDHLRARGIDLPHDPVTVEGTGLNGHRFVYFQDPDGFQVEYIQRPEHLAGVTVGGEAFSGLGTPDGVVPTPSA